MSVSSLSNHHLDIVRLISKEVNTATKISKALKISRSTIQRRLEELEEHKFVGKIIAGNTRPFILTTAGVEVLNLNLESSNVNGEVLKAHKVHWSAVITRKPWSLHDDLLKQSFVVSKNNRWSQYKKEDAEEGVVILFNPNKVHFFIHEFFINSPFEYYEKAVTKLRRISAKLCDMFPGLVLGEPKKVFSVHSQHIVKQGGPLSSRFALEAHKTGVAQVFHGKNLNVDHSKGIWEEETVDNRLAPAHMVDLGQFFDDWLEKPFFVSEFHDLKDEAGKLREESAKEIKGVSDKVEVFDLELKNFKHEALSLTVENKKEVGVVVSRVDGIQEEVVSLKDDLNSNFRALSQGQLVLQEGLQGLAGSLNALGESHARTAKSMDTFAFAMHEHVTLIKALQENAKAQGDAIRSQEKVMLELVDLFKEASRPWYVKFADFIKKSLKKAKFK